MSLRDPCITYRMGTLFSFKREVRASSDTRLILRKYSPFSADCGTSLKNNHVSLAKSCDDDSDSSLPPVDNSDCDPELEVSSESESSDTEDSLSGSEDKSVSQLDDNPSTIVHTSQVSDAQSSSSDKCSCYYTRTDNVAGAAIGEITRWDADSSHWVGDLAEEVYPHLRGRRGENNFGKITLSTFDRDSDLELPVIGSFVYCESSALDHAATEA
uniref:Uncharacterized protein n=1 Tax=Timema shepardi TaxID=629360 RepID=A0A7R9AUK9_TIMSH|nr:unnamed protein product [Timema shepardi]